MTQQEMIELIQQLFPDIGETQVRLLLNNAYKKFIGDIKLYSAMNFTANSVANQRYYSFSDFANVTNDDDIIEVTRVDFDGDMIKRYQGTIETTDVT